MSFLNKSPYRFRIVLGIGLVGTCLVAAVLVLQAWEDRAQETSAGVDQVTDVSDPRGLAGIADSIFVGVVEEEVGSEQLGDLPETQYRVLVTHKLKGRIGETVIVNQFAGERPDGSQFTIEGDEPLHVGQEYLFASLTHPNGQWETVVDVYGTREINSAAQRQQLIDTFRHAAANPLPPEAFWRPRNTPAP